MIIIPHEPVDGEDKRKCVAPPANQSAEITRLTGMLGAATEALEWIAKCPPGQEKRAVFLARQIVDLLVGSEPPAQITPKRGGEKSETEEGSRASHGLRPVTEAARADAAPPATLTENPDGSFDGHCNYRPVKP